MPLRRVYHNPPLLVVTNRVARCGPCRPSRQLPATRLSAIMRHSRIEWFPGEPGSVDESHDHSALPATQPASPSGVPLLRMTGISKFFPGVQALKDVSLEVYPGECLALVGENGAGKSTLMKILSGVYAPDEGHIELESQPVTLSNPHQAQRLGISIIYQE